MTRTEMDWITQHIYVYTNEQTDLQEFQKLWLIHANKLELSVFGCGQTHAHRQMDGQMNKYREKKNKPID